MREVSADSSPIGDAMNKNIEVRLKGIHEGMLAAYQAGKSTSSASKGIEREIFITRLLAQVLPPIFRFGHGDIIDTRNQKSGQIDIVIENPFFPSLPIVEHGPRLYLAEGVAAAIEVKSDIAKQWSDVESTANKLHALIPCPGGVKGNSTLAMADCQVPLFAVGFQGWKSLKSATDLVEDGRIDGIFIVDNGILSIHKKYNVVNVEHDPVRALWMFLCCLHDRITSIRSISTTPLIYFEDADDSSGQRPSS